MSIPSHIIYKWRAESKTELPRIRDDILTGRNFVQYSYKDVLGFAIVLILSCKPDAANRVLEKLFQISDISFSSEEQMMLELFWNSFPGRPSNTPWEVWPKARINETKRVCDPKGIEFYGKWTRTDWIAETLKIDIREDYDPHQWKDSQDVWTLAICTRILCQPKDGKVPSQEIVREAFEAVDKLLTTLPLRGPHMPHSHVFETRIYFMLALYLGHVQKARETMNSACQLLHLDIHHFLDIPALYEMLAQSMDDPPIQFEEEEMNGVVEELCGALTTRAEQGREELLYDISMAELLRRFSQAAFFVHEQDYRKNGIETPEKVLLAPISAERIAKIEEELGPLPPDVKEMALIADGFYGGWHFAGGGWAGISNLCTMPAEGYEICFGYEPEPERRVETRTREDGTTYEVTMNIIAITAEGSGNDWGDVYQGNGASECDDYEHILCPHETWKKMQASKGEEVKVGEYAFLYFAHWTDGGDIMASVRAWIAGMTMELERDVAAGIKEIHDDD